MLMRMGIVLAVIGLIGCGSVSAAFEYCVDTSGPWHWMYPFPLRHSLHDVWAAPVTRGGDAGVGGKYEKVFEVLKGYRGLMTAIGRVTPARI